MRILPFLVALALPASALAEPWDGPGQQPRTWVTNPTFSTTTVPADALEPADVADTGFVESDWIVSVVGTSDYVTTNGAEKKFRTECEPAKAAIFDPVLYQGVAGPVGHRHQFTSNFNVNENSTFATLRASPSSTCPGSPLNATAYWEPEMLTVLPSGVTAGIRPDKDVFYYVNGYIGETNKSTWLRRGFTFIGGANPMDYNDATRRAEYAAGGFEYPGGTETPAGVLGLICLRGSDLAQVTVSRLASRSGTDHTSRHLKAEDGSDPWGGACTGTFAQPAQLILEMNAPDCWDGKNLHSPDGRSHVAYSARKPDNSVLGACPDNWVHVPSLQTKKIYKHTGFADYGSWWYSSDRMNPANTPADPSSFDPCRRTGPWFCPGSTAHFDWMYGWKSAIADEWQRECLGITVRGVAPVNGPATCDASRISQTRILQYGASPNPALSGGCTSLTLCTDARPGLSQRYNPIATGTKGRFVIKSHAH